MSSAIRQARLDMAGLVRDAMPSACPKEPPFASQEGAVVAIGAFDGVHLGHRLLVEAAMRDARMRGAAFVVVTFDPDPSEVFETMQGRRLLSVADRSAQLAHLGADYVLVLPFTSELSQLAPDAFVRLLGQRLGKVLSVHVGSNFRFGRAGSGTVDTLGDLGERAGFAVVVHDLLTCDGEVVSSTRIRGLLGEGRVADAVRLLGRHHFVRGQVAHGRGEGTSFGFPTANVWCDAYSCLPAEGVYACVVTDGTRAWPSAANVGAPPTFASQHASLIEANLIGFSGDLYGRDLAVVFLEWLRGSRAFSSLDELERVVLDNIEWVRTHVGDSGVEVRP